jgi:hypothetical protein
MAWRWLWYLPLMLLAGCAMAAIVAGVLAWGSVQYSRFPAWIPTFDGIALGGVCLLGASLCLLKLHRNLAVPFHVRGVPIVLGLAAIVGLIHITTALVQVVGDPNRYHGRENESSSAIHVEDAWGRRPQFGDGSPTGSVLTTIVAIFPGPISWLLAGAYFLYAKGFPPVSKHVPPVDAMGEIMRTA